LVVVHPGPSFTWRCPTAASFFRKARIRLEFAPATIAEDLEPPTDETVPLVATEGVGNAFIPERASVGTTVFDRIPSGEDGMEI
jgi:hypothetical protein